MSAGQVRGRGQAVRAWGLLGDDPRAAAGGLKSKQKREEGLGRDAADMWGLPGAPGPVGTSRLLNTQAAAGSPEGLCLRCQKYLAFVYIQVPRRHPQERVWTWGSG